MAYKQKWKNHIMVKCKLSLEAKFNSVENIQRWGACPQMESSMLTFSTSLRPSVSSRIRVWFGFSGWGTHHIQIPLMCDCTEEPRKKPAAGVEIKGSAILMADGPGNWDKS